MLQTTDVIQGALKLLASPDNFCWTSFDDFLKDFPKLFGVEVPATITNVIVSNAQPLDSERDTVWFRTDNAGSFVGIYLYGAGTWQQMFPPPGNITKIVGDSSNPPAGYVVATHTNVPQISAAMTLILQASWYPPADPIGPWTMFDVVFVGY